MDKFLLWGNAGFCLFLTILFVGFPGTLAEVSLPETASMARALGFAYLPAAFLALLANRLKHNIELLLSAYFTLAMLHFGAAIVQGINAYQGMGPLPLAFTHFFLLFFTSFRLIQIIRTFQS